MKVLVSNGGTAGACRADLAFRFDVINQQVTQGDQVGDVHRDASPNNVPMGYLALKQGRSVWPLLSEGEHCECVVTLPLKRKINRSIAKHFVDVVRVDYRYFDLRHILSSMVRTGWDAPDFVEVGEAGIAMGDAMRRERVVQLVG